MITRYVVSRTSSEVHGSPNEWRASYVEESRQRSTIGCGTRINTKSRDGYENANNDIKPND